MIKSEHSITVTLKPSVWKAKARSLHTRNASFLSWESIHQAGLFYRTMNTLGQGTIPNCGQRISIKPQKNIKMPGTREHTAGQARAISTSILRESTDRHWPEGRVQCTVASWNYPGDFKTQRSPPGSEALPDYRDSHKLPGHPNMPQSLRTLV